LRVAVLAGGLTGAVVLAATAPAATFRPKTVVVRDHGGDVAAPAPDLTRVALSRGSDGRIRAALTLGGEWKPGDLLTRSGPPGSLCVRLWTVAVPPNTAPDYIVCVTAQDSRRLRATVLQERPDRLPRVVGPAAVSQRGKRSVVVRFSQTSVGRPALIRFAAEATRAGCVRPSCVDTAPDAPATATFRLRRATAAGH
jgi:hypothetical protein